MELNGDFCNRILLAILTLVVWFKSTYQLKYGYRLESATFNKLDTAGRKVCEKNCVYRTKCLSYNLNKMQRECQLNYKDTSTSSSLVEDSGFEYGEKSAILNVLKGPCASIVCPMNSMCIEIHSGYAKCLQTECEEPPSVTNALMLETIRAVAKTISYTCKTGYAPRGSTSISCKASGKWTTPQFECKDCGSPPSLGFASVAAPSVLLGSRATYTCVTGYYMSGVGYITCQSGAVWTTINFQCKIVDCGSPTSVSNANTLVPQTTYQSTATYNCNSGYDMSGSNSVTCQASGSWSSVGFQCIPRDCGEPSSFSYGYASYSATTYGNTATYQCNSGYTMRDGSSTISCQASGSWSTTSAYCGCGSLPTTNGGHVGSGSYRIGSSRSFSCSKDDCICVGGGSTVCQSSGSWTSILCVYCGTPPLMRYASYTGTTIGNTATYYCNSGLTIYNSSIISCQSNAVWSTTSAYCDGYMPPVREDSIKSNQSPFSESSNCGASPSFLEFSLSLEKGDTKDEEQVMQETGACASSCLSRPYVSPTTTRDTCRLCGVSEDNVKSNFSYLKRNLYPEELLDIIEGKHHLTSYQLEDIKCAKLRRRKVDVMVKTHVFNGKPACNMFMDVLSTTEGCRFIPEEMHCRHICRSKDTVEEFCIESQHIKNNEEYIVDNVDPEEVADLLVEEYVLSMDDHEEIVNPEVHKSRRSKCKEMVKKLCNLNENALKMFIYVLKKGENKQNGKVANKLESVCAKTQRNSILKFLLPKPKTGKRISIKTSKKVKAKVAEILGY